MKGNGQQCAATGTGEFSFNTPLKDLKLTNHFLFEEVLCEPHICRTVLEIILDRKISQVTFYNREQQVDIHPSYRGICLDICFTDENNSVYNLELQTANRSHIPRRSRHYQSMIDVKVMHKGENDYGSFPDGVIVFICTFDLFGYGRYCYTFENRCLEEPELSLGDGTMKIFLNTKGKNDSETSRELIEFLHCIEHTGSIQPESGRVREILERVKEVKKDMEREGRYMTVMERVNEIKAEGREEGILIGKVTVYAQLGLSVRQIAEKLDVSEEEVSRVLEETVK
mgnify:FL=1